MLRTWKSVLAALLALAWLAGCRTAPPAPQAPRPSVASPEPEPIPPPAPVVEPAASVEIVAVEESLIIAPPGPLVVPPELLAPSANALPLSLNGAGWPSNWVNAWVALESWCKFNGLPTPQQISGGLDAVFQLQTSAGPMTFKMGSQAVRAGGSQFLLGFAPRLIKGLPYVHSQDARKTLQPLLNPAFPMPAGRRTVVIDAGHGGKDGGSRGPLATDLEKHYALDWALRLQQLMAARGWNVVMTRTNDSFLTLADRVAVAEAARADLFLSLHFNSGNGNAELSGLETYCLTPTGLPSNILRDDEDDARQMHPNNAFDELNFVLASRLHRSLLQASGATDRGVRRARFMGVLRGQNRPAVLIEGGYLSNPREARLIGTPAYRQKLAEGVARALE